MKIICFGDSLTFGHGLASKDKWHAIVARKTGLEMFNRGVSGNTTSEMLVRFNRQVLLMKPDAVIIMGGYNDIFFEGSYQSAQKNIELMIDKGEKKGIKVIVAVPPPIKPPIPFFETIDQENFNVSIVNDYLDWLKMFVKKRNLQSIDFTFGIDWMRQDLYIDGVHPNVMGNELMAQKVIAFFSKI
ncbi:GDSL-type esterase/lipase family protein [Eubacteriaceae bacterium ES2]|nr:GDSL-type esterase/lipase family protein [Eubacteriaceae bacterium ES2]